MTREQGLHSRPSCLGPTASEHPVGAGPDSGAARISPGPRRGATGEPSVRRVLEADCAAAGSAGRSGWRVSRCSRPSRCACWRSGSGAAGNRRSGLHRDPPTARGGGPTSAGPITPRRSRSDRAGRPRPRRRARAAGGLAGLLVTRRRFRGAGPCGRLTRPWPVPTPSAARPSTRRAPHPSPGVPAAGTAPHAAGLAPHFTIEAEAHPSDKVVTLHWPATVRPWSASTATASRGWPTP